MQSEFLTQSPQPNQGQKKSNTWGDPVHPQVSLFVSQTPKMTVKDWSTLSTHPFSSFLSERFPRTCLLLYQQTSVLSTSCYKLKCIREILKNVSAPQTGLRYLCFLSHHLEDLMWKEMQHILVQGCAPERIPRICHHPRLDIRCWAFLFHITCSLQNILKVMHTYLLPQNITTIQYNNSHQYQQEI
jgi:hypothetical protein